MLPEQLCSSHEWGLLSVTCFYNKWQSLDVALAKALDGSCR